MFDTISAADQFDVVLFSNQVHARDVRASYVDCNSAQMLSGSHYNKNSIFRWLKDTDWTTPNESNYSMAFDQAFKSLNASTTLEKDVNIVLFVSSVAQNDDSRLMFEVFNRYKHLAAVVHTYGMRDSRDDILTAISRQDGTNFSVNRNEEAVEGHFTNVRDLDDLR